MFLSAPKETFGRQRKMHCYLYKANRACVWMRNISSIERRQIEIFTIFNLHS